LLATEKNDLQVQQALTRQKLQKYKREQEGYEEAKEEMAQEASEMAKQLRENELTIAKLKREATYRERVLAERDKQFVAMRETNQKAEAARSLLEMRIRELQEEHDPVKGEVLELKAMVADLEAAVLREGERCSAAEGEAQGMHARVAALTSQVKEAEKSAADADTFNRTTLGDLTQIVENAKPSWLQLVEYVRKRTDRARAIGRFGGTGGGEHGVTDKDPDVLAELTRQRNRMEKTVTRLSSELKAAKTRNRVALLQRGQEASLVLADQAELQRENVALRTQLNATRAQLAKVRSR